MTQQTDPSNSLPPGLTQRLEAATGSVVREVRPRGGGGASRFGAELVLAGAAGEQRAYLAYNAARAASSGGAGLGSRQAFHREVAVLAALTPIAAQAGIRLAPLLASDEATAGILTGFVAGEANYHSLSDPAERLAVSADFMAQLARLHALDISGPEFEALQPSVPASEAIRARIQALRDTRLRQWNDPLIALALNWLEDNVPPDPPRNVLVHGDAGPANFLFADGRVTALLDWELTHAGDPHADLAMIAIRNLFQPFIPLKDAFRLYEEAGGVPVDLDRVRYYRVYFQTQFASPPEAMNHPDAPLPPAFGTNLVFATVHMRVLAEALGEAMGIALSPVSLPEAPAGAHARSFEAALTDLRDYIVPRLKDQEAAAKAKGLARLVKWWRDLERWGPAFEEAACKELSEALGERFSGSAEGRSALCRRICERSIEPALALRLCHAGVSRNAALYADAMGAFASTGFKPLD